MGLHLMPVLVGTLPVIAVIAPTVLAGSFAYMGSLKLDNGEPEFTWAGTANTVALAASAVILIGFMLLAAYYVELTLREKQEEIDKIEIDEEVKKYDDEQEVFREAYKEVTQWDVVPRLAKVVLFLALVSIITSFYMFQLFHEDAFTSYQLTDTVDKNLGGNWKNLIKPLGWFALLLFSISTCLQVVFNMWATVRKHLANSLFWY